MEVMHTNPVSESASREPNLQQVAAQHQTYFIGG